jgi:hypothetical protein
MKKGQIKLSFGMIFSIFLIIVFLIFGFFAIKNFIGLGKTAQIGSFKDSLQNDIDRVWKGAQGSETVEYILPSGIISVCFIDYEKDASGSNSEFYSDFNQVHFGDENLFFYPVGSAEGLDSTEINHLDLEKITEQENPYCFFVSSGKISVQMTKQFGETLVTLKR